MSNTDSYRDMLAAVQAFHDKHDFKHRGGENMAYRVALMAEELGEISACVTKGKDNARLAEETADFNLNDAFWAKMKTLESRESRMVNGRIRVSEFTDM